MYGWALVVGCEYCIRSTRRSASHPPEIVALDIREGIVPEGWPRGLGVSTLQIRTEFWHPTATQLLVESRVTNADYWGTTS